MDTTLEKKARDWAQADPDPATRQQVLELLSRGDEAALEDAFGESLQFGTAGLRGVLGGGTNRMNRAVVRRTTAGLAAYLLRTVPQVATRGVVVGRDGRRMSLQFAQDTALVLAAAGIPVHFFPQLASTPLTAFAVTNLGAAAGVMVTASHNPPEYNGYKVYWSNGAQIIPPHDAGIAQAIAQVGPASGVPLLSEAEARRAGRWQDIGPALEEAYFEAILGLRLHREPHGLSIVYSAMHGVGGRFMLEALRRAGFTQVSPVPEQLEPDGEFPTVKFPNPEEPGAMDLSTALAARTGADLVLAHDPDADRLAVMARDGAGQLRLLTGNEVGVLLGHALLTLHGWRQPLVITTIVSSAQLKAMASRLGARYEETLTGFKWIANRALELEPQGLQFVYGYEEALGYTVGTVARDKDGVGTALVVAGLAAWCKGRGTTLLGYLEEIQRQHGVFAAKQYNATLPGAAGAQTIGRVMQAFRASPPPRLGAHAVLAVNDYQARTRTEGGATTPLSLPRADVLAYELDGGGRVTLRPSGTEPKIKFYFELAALPQATEAIAAVKGRLETALAALESAFLAEARSRGLP